MKTDERIDSEYATFWNIRSDTTYLNHGSFGPAPRQVREFRRKIIDELDQQPMDFYVRQMEPLLSEARSKVAQFVGTELENLVFVENATFGMNVVAESFKLKPGDEVLLNNHEYGAVHRIWQRKADEAQAKVVVAQLPESFESTEQIVDCLKSKATENTRLVVVSHITSPTAIILPIKEICQAFRELGVVTCIDGPHAPAHVDIDIDDLGCDFYVASCHKWLCATLGTGFCYAHPRWHDKMQPVLKSWGRLLPAMPETWDEEFIWSGTRDPSGYLSIPVAIEVLQSIGLDKFREHAYGLAGYARERLVDLTGQSPIAPKNWYGCMAHVPLPDGNYNELQQWLWNNKGIEVPIVDFDGRWFVRVSCHLYNRRDQIDLLVDSLQEYMN